MIYRSYRGAILSALLSLALGTGVAATTLKEAVMAGDMAEVRRLLDEGADLNSAGVGSPLYFAAQRGHAEIVVLLLERGADANTVTRFGTPLQIAARGNRVDIVETLLKQGADPNLAGGEYAKTPLHEAAERGAREAALLLLQSGADVNGRTKLGHPPIHLAASKGKDEMVMLLREHGAAPVSVEPLDATEIAAADVAKGKLRVIECERCHVMEAGKPPAGVTPGPNLWNVVGREIASMQDYAYSEALADREGAWTYEELNRFLADPTGFVPGTHMVVGFEPDRAVRIPLIAYLRTLADEPVPLK